LVLTAGMLRLLTGFLLPATLLLARLLLPALMLLSALIGVIRHYLVPFESGDVANGATLAIETCS
jgi:hypothetical protein